MNAHQNSDLTHREPSLGGESGPAPAFAPTSNEPALSLERLLPGFRDSFTSEDRATRERIIADLTGDRESAVLALLQLLRGSTDTRTRQRCAAMLGQIRDPRAIPALVELFDSPDIALRRVAVWAIGQIRDEDTIPMLLDLLGREEDPRVLGAVLHTISNIIGTISDVTTLPLMFRLSQHPNRAVAREAEKAMLADRPISAPWPS